MTSRRFILSLLATFIVCSANRADSLLLNVATSHALVPGKANANGVREPIMFGVEEKKDQPRHRWVFVKTAKGFLIKSASSGLALVPIFETRNERHGKLTLVKVTGEGKEYQRWQFAKTKHGYLIQNAETGMSLVPIREEAGQNGGKLVLFRIEDEMMEGGLVDQNRKLVNYGPDK